MKVAVIQHDPVWHDRDATLAALAPTVAAAAAGGARLVVLPELFATGFSMATEVIGEPRDGPTADWMRARAAEHDVWLAGSVPEVRPGDDRPGNTCVVAAPDGTTHRYTKIHPFIMAGEPDHFRPGDAHLTVTIDGVRVTPTICYDLRFPEQYRATADGTDVYLVVASWPAARGHHWSSLLVARAIEDQAYVVAANRCGVDGNGLAQAGRSAIIDPVGQRLVEAGDVPTILIADLDPAVVRDTRERLPFLSDRRPVPDVGDGGMPTADAEVDA